jgi:hypothetical protein
VSKRKNSIEQEYRAYRTVTSKIIVNPLPTLAQTLAEIRYRARVKSIQDGKSKIIVNPHYLLLSAEKPKEPLGRKALILNFHHIKKPKSELKSICELNLLAVRKSKS